LTSASEKFFGTVSGKVDDQAGIAGFACPLSHRLEDRIRRITPHRLSAAAAVQLRSARVQQFHVIGELGHGADRGTRGTHRVGLVDRDRRWNTLDPVHLRLVHAPRNWRAYGENVST